MVYFAAELYFMLRDLKFLFCSVGVRKHKSPANRVSYDVSYLLFTLFIQPLAAYFFVFVRINLFRVYTGPSHEVVIVLLFAKPKETKLGTIKTSDKSVKYLKYCKKSQTYFLRWEFKYYLCQGAASLAVKRCCGFQDGGRGPPRLVGGQLTGG